MDVKRDREERKLFSSQEPEFRCQNKTLYQRPLIMVNLFGYTALADDAFILTPGSCILDSEFMYEKSERGQSIN
jgi:hypothetical protein